ncbi:hypothetical protein CRE_05942 [Caenorhabditis remanei]|uniref:Uncharacterized protein n=1 Tax=Caenorhabditis remanei TaxID=31234 RepID=E3MZE6_CAERE|nr:hypothetical protein CRE_05942 [Caenorhabditis remanei]
MSFCTDHNKSLCEYAFGLRYSVKSDCLDIYLFGAIDPETMAAYIIHNNEFHNGWTYEQLGHLLRIMDSRTKIFGHVYNWRHIIKMTERKVDEYNARKQQARLALEEQKETEDCPSPPVYGQDDVVEITPSLPDPVPPTTRRSAFVAYQSSSTSITSAGTQSRKRQGQVSNSTVHVPPKRHLQFDGTLELD